MQWPPRSPYLTSSDFFAVFVFVPPLLLDIDKLQLRITVAIETNNRNMSERVWDKARLITRGGGIYNLLKLKTEQVGSKLLFESKSGVGCPC
jgi:hypothetical protein